MEIESFFPPYRIAGTIPVNRVRRAGPFPRPSRTWPSIVNVSMIPSLRRLGLTASCRLSFLVEIRRHEAGAAARQINQINNSLIEVSS
jgi:hypothetical protein